MRLRTTLQNRRYRLFGTRTFEGLDMQGNVPLKKLFCFIRSSGCASCQGTYLVRGRTMGYMSFPMNSPVNDRLPSDLIQPYYSVVVEQHNMGYKNGNLWNVRIRKISFFCTCIFAIYRNTKKLSPLNNDIVYQMTTYINF